jgi:hypothetical protein
MSTSATHIGSSRHHSARRPRADDLGFTGPRRLGLGAFAKRATIYGMTALLVSGLAHAIAHPARAESEEAAVLIASLAGGDGESITVTESVSEQLGYRPVPSGGRLLKPTGSCSTPLPLSPESFETACRAHDLGYDTLRVAETSGSRLGGWARFDLDARFYADMLDTCRKPSCRATATLFYGAVTLNSIRQGYGAPREEPTLPWVTLILGILAVAMLTAGWRRGNQLDSTGTSKIRTVVGWEAVGNQRSAALMARPIDSMVRSISASPVDQFDTATRRSLSPRHVVAPSQAIPSC